MITAYRWTEAINVVRPRRTTVTNRSCVALTATVRSDESVTGRQPQMGACEIGSGRCPGELARESGRCDMASTRFDKLARNVFAPLCLAATIVW